MAQIYKITNLINNKIYIGQTNGKRARYFGGGTILKDAIKKYGKENFKKEIIIEGDFNQELLNDLEIHYIRLFNSSIKNKKGYNIKDGGNGNIHGFKMSEKTKYKISKALKGRKGRKQTSIEREQNRKRGIEFWNNDNNVDYINNLKDKLRNANKLRNEGRTYPDYHRKAISKGRLGIKFSEEQIKNMSTSHINSPAYSVEIVQLSMDLQFIAEFPSISEAARVTTLSTGQICDVIKGNHNYARKFKFMYKQDWVNGVPYENRKYETTVVTKQNLKARENKTASEIKAKRNKK